MSTHSENRPRAEWLANQFSGLSDRLMNIEKMVSSLEENLLSSDPNLDSFGEREYYSVAEFAVIVGRKVYTVREWCRYERIHAEKCDTGRGESKNWKIPADELQRYRDHGLLPMRY